MKPALFTYPYIIDAFPVLMLLGFFFGWFLARRRASVYNIAPHHLDNLALLLPIAGVFGGRVFARLFYAKLPLLESLKVWEGDGLVFYGGFLFGCAAVAIYAWVRRINLVSLMDCVAPGIALGLAFGRIGCFLAGCCWGDVCVSNSILSKVPAETARQIHTWPKASSPNWPLAVEFPFRSEPHKQHVKRGLIPEGQQKSLPIHPVQIYEAVLTGLLCLWLARRFRGGHNPGAAALTFLAGYAAIRFTTEFLRADN